MTRPDEVMEKVLAGLRDVEAPVGMERRILERLENVAEMRGRPGWRQLWLGHTGMTWGLGCGVVAMAILIALAIPAVHRRGPVAVRGNDVGAKAVAGREAVADSARGSVGKKRVWGGMASVSSQTQVRVSDAQGDEDSVAMSETRAASFPAPPMPLTDEEKLLLRMVHQGDSVELAMLDPKMEALREAEEKEEFQRFFAKAAVKESEGDAVPVSDQTAPLDEKASPVEKQVEEPKQEQSTTVETK
jgi:hypothetical protein